VDQGPERRPGTASPGGDRCLLIIRGPKGWEIPFSASGSPVARLKAKGRGRKAKGPGSALSGTRQELSRRTGRPSFCGAQKGGFFSGPGHTGRAPHVHVKRGPKRFLTHPLQSLFLGSSNSGPRMNTSQKTAFCGFVGPPPTPEPLARKPSRGCGRREIMPTGTPKADSRERRKKTAVGGGRFYDMPSRNGPGFAWPRLNNDGDEETNGKR